jgi:Xaa-Pro aminopeptidase
LIFPAGGLKVRSNDTDYLFRAHSDFAWLTGIIATDCVPDSVFVMEPNTLGHEELLFTHPRSSRDSEEFYKDTKYGEFWVGKRMSLNETQSKYQLKVMQLDLITQFLSDKKESLLIRGVDQRVDANG